MTLQGEASHPPFTEENTEAPARFLLLEAGDIQLTPGKSLLLKRKRENKIKQELGRLGRPARLRAPGGAAAAAVCARAVGGGPGVLGVCWQPAGRGLVSPSLECSR